MNLNETTHIDQITVSKNGNVFYRVVTETRGQGGDVVRSYHRFSLIPGQSIDGLPDEVQRVCADAWTPEVVAAYLASL
jgi:hypothetical protein